MRRVCAVCSVDLEPRPVLKRVYQPTLGREVYTRVRAMPRHARVRLSWEGSQGLTPEQFEQEERASRATFGVCLCLACVQGKQLGQLVAVLGDRLLERGL